MYFVYVDKISVDKKTVDGRIDIVDKEMFMWVTEMGMVVNVWCNFKSCCWRMPNTIIPTSHLHQLLESSKIFPDWRPGPSKIPSNRCRDKQLRLTTSICGQISKPLSPLPWISCFFHRWFHVSSAMYPPLQVSSVMKNSLIGFGSCPRPSPKASPSKIHTP